MHRHRILLTNQIVIEHNAKAVLKSNTNHANETQTYPNANNHVVARRI
jgi:hypothetical protein